MYHKFMVGDKVRVKLKGKYYRRIGKIVNHYGDNDESAVDIDGHVELFKNNQLVFIEQSYYIK